MSDINDSSLTDPVVDTTDTIADPVAEVATIEEKPAPTIAPVTPQSVELSQEVFNTTAKFDKAKETLSIPPDLRDRIVDILNGLPQGIDLGDTEEGRLWSETMTDSLTHSSFNGAYVKNLENPRATYKQAVTAPSGPLQGSHPRFNATENTVLKGDQAVMRLMSHTGLGSIYRTPLWHTGVWVTFRAPAEAELLELHRQLISEKILFGRQTYGLAFSNAMVYTNERMFQFALDHIYQTTLKNNVALKDVISCHDIPNLVHGLLCAIYPGGVQYNRPCSANPAECGHIEHAKLNPSKILWVDTSALTDWQIAHMSKFTTNSCEAETVQRYKDELLATQKRSITLNTDNNTSITCTLRLPTAAQHIEAGHRWIGDIVTMVDRTLGMTADLEERNQYVLNKSRATSMRQYQHFVESINFDTVSIEDIETIENSLGSLSSDDEVRKSFLEQVVKYEQDTAITVIGIPTYDCPKCGQENADPKPSTRHVNIIPIDIYNSFFTLLVQKLERIIQR